MKSKLIKVITSSRLTYPKNPFDDTKYIRTPKIQIEETGWNPSASISGTACRWTMKKAPYISTPHRRNQNIPPNPHDQKAYTAEKPWKLPGLFCRQYLYS